MERLSDSMTASVDCEQVEVLTSEGLDVCPVQLSHHVQSFVHNTLGQSKKQNWDRCSEGNRARTMYGKLISTNVANTSQYSDKL